MTLHEPATFATDLLLAGLGLCLALRLRRAPPASARNWWIVSISLMAASAFVGAFYHGFSPEVPAAVEARWWLVVLWIICALGFAMGMSLLREFDPPRSHLWQGLLAVKFAISCTAASLKPEFIVAMADYGSAMLAWTLAALAARRVWCGAILAGVGFSLMAAVIQQSKPGLTEFFNHNDLFHVVQAFALFAFYRAGCKLGEGPGGDRGRYRLRARNAE